MIMEREKESQPYPIDYPTCISDGNKKIGKIPNVSLPPIVSCQPGVPCAKQGCYSMKAWNQYPDTRRARRHNWAKLHHDRNAFFQDIYNYLVLKPRQRKFPLFFRWNVDGDIPNQDYLEGMKEVARAHTKVKMLAFTKNYTLNFDSLPQNLTVVPSAWPHHPLCNDVDKRFRMAWMWDNKNRDERIKGNYYVCSGHCTGCWACWHIDQMEKDVLFHKH
jgi:hypothetical protein